MTLPDTAPLAIGTNRPALALTPDGATLLYVARIHGEHRLMAKGLPVRTASDRFRVARCHRAARHSVGANGGILVGWDLIGVPVAGGAHRTASRPSPP